MTKVNAKARHAAASLRSRAVWLGAGVALVVVFLPGCFILHRHRSTDLANRISPGEQPDKVLYGKALNEFKHGRYDVGRLTLQTLINTYPDSEYLAKAKLAIADSYYNEGGVSGLTQAEAEYKDFITFFPTAPEAPEAEFRAGMSHFRLMGKYDRDESEAREAEVEFKEFLEKYPDSPIAPRVKGRLREVQEVLAEADYEVARYYYERGAAPAARLRFEEIADKYPNFSQADRALWYLGQTLERLRKSGEAAPYYARIITDYPLSPEVPNAKHRLAALHQPIPRPTKAMLARARADAARQRPSRLNVVADMEGMMSSSPDVSHTRHGPVRIGEPPPGEVEEAKANAPPKATTSVSVQPLGGSDSSAASTAGPATPPDPTPAGGTAQPVAAASGAHSAPSVANGSSTGAAAAASKKQADASSSDSSPSVPPKKSKFHFLRKLIPF